MACYLYDRTGSCNGCSYMKEDKACNNCSWTAAINLAIHNLIYPPLPPTMHSASVPNGTELKHLRLTPAWGSSNVQIATSSWTPHERGQSTYKWYSSTFEPLMVSSLICLLLCTKKTCLITWLCWIFPWGPHQVSKRNKNIHGRSLHHYPSGGQPGEAHTNYLC